MCWSFHKRRSILDLLHLSKSLRLLYFFVWNFTDMFILQVIQLLSGINALFYWFGLTLNTQLVEILIAFLNDTKHIIMILLLILILLIILIFVNMTILLEIANSSDLFIHIGNSYFISEFIFFILFFFNLNRDFIFEHHFICYMLRVQLKSVHLGNYR